MNEYPSILLYAETHEWVLTGEDNTITSGISHHAQDALGDVVYVELPKVGSEVTAGQSVAQVESVKAASDINAPVSGKIIEVNRQLTDNPELINSSPYSDGWIFKMAVIDNAELQYLMDSNSYRELCQDSH